MQDELEVIAHAKTDPEAFGRLYDTYYQPVFGFLYGRVGNAEVAKDLTSETFFQALKNLHKYKPQKGKKFKSWLFAIAVAQVGNYFRGRAKMFQVSTDEAPELVAQDDFRPDVAARMGEDEVALKEKIVLLRKVMSQLNEKQQNILTLRYFSKMTVPEIAIVLRMKEGTIKSHIHRALKKLRVLMESDQTNEKGSYEGTKATSTRSAFGSSRG